MPISPTAEQGLHPQGSAGEHVSSDLFCMERPVGSGVVSREEHFIGTILSSLMTVIAFSRLPRKSDFCL